MLAHGLRKMMLNQRVGRGEERALVTVISPDEIRRLAVVTVDFHDHALAALIPT